MGELDPGRRDDGCESALVAVDALLAEECVQDLERVQSRVRGGVSSFDAAVLSGVLSVWLTETRSLLQSVGEDGDALAARVGELSRVADAVEDVLSSLAEWTRHLGG